MTYGQKLKVKIGIGGWYYWSSDLELVSGRTVGNVSNVETQVQYMYVCTVVSSTSKLDGEKYIHNSSILWWNGMKLQE